MEKTIFQGEECYIAYKGLKKDLTNFQNNYKYEPGYWYKTLNVDMEDDDCSYGLNLAVDYWSGICFGGKVFKAYVPIKNNKIKFIKCREKFRCQIFYLDKEIDVMKYWDGMTEEQRNFMCMHNSDMVIDKYWLELTESQRNLICKFNKNFNIDKYWPELTEYQRELICEYNENFDADKYWHELTEYQRDLICRLYKDIDIDIDKYWPELTEYQRDLVCKYAFKNMDIDKYRPQLTKRQKKSLYRRVVLKSKERPKITA